MRVLVTKVNDLQEQVRFIQPQTYPHPIPKPRQGKEFSKFTSVAGWLFDAITELNQDIVEGNRKYLQFPEEVDFRRLNSDCIRELEGLMSFQIPDLCGKVTWEKAYSRRPKDCEKVIRKARVLPELAVFAQAAGQWALRMLCANKMRTLMATNLKKSGKQRTRKVSNEQMVGEDDDCALQDDIEKLQTGTHMSALTLQEIGLSARQDHEELECCHTIDEDAESEIEDATRSFESGERSGERKVMGNGEDHSISNDDSAIEELEATETQNVRTCLMRKDSRATETARNTCAATVQIAAQIAAKRALSPIAEHPYRHKIVFNDLSTEDVPEIQNQCALNDNSSAVGNKGNPLSRTTSAKVNVPQNCEKKGPGKDVNDSQRKKIMERGKQNTQRLERARSQNIRIQPSSSTKLNAASTAPGSSN